MRVASRILPGISMEEIISPPLMLPVLDANTTT
jgi:hypothetical protein